MSDDDYPMPGQTDFTADEEQQMRQGQAAQNSPTTPNPQNTNMLTPKGRAIYMNQTDPIPAMPLAILATRVTSSTPSAVRLLYRK
jgi:hypothetical protein